MNIKNQEKLVSVAIFFYQTLLVAVGTARHLRPESPRFPNILDYEQ